MPIVAYVLKRPYTVVAALILICLLGIGAGLRMPVDIFPEIDIPVVSVVWTYNGMNAKDIQNRILTIHERQMASLVDDISRIEATSYDGVGVEKIYLHEGADVTRAVSQLASSALVVLKYMPPNITPPLGYPLWRNGCADHPVKPVEQLLARYQTERSWARTSSAPILLSCMARKCLILMAANLASLWRISTSKPCKRAGCRRPMSAKPCSIKTSSYRPVTLKWGARIIRCP